MTVRTRVRRGKVVVIPEAWVGNITTKPTLRERKELAAKVRLDRKKRLRTDYKFDMEQQL